MEAILLDHKGEEVRIPLQKVREARLSTEFPEYSESFRDVILSRYRFKIKQHYRWVGVCDWEGWGRTMSGTLLKGWGTKAGTWLKIVGLIRPDFLYSILKIAGLHFKQAGDSEAVEFDLNFWYFIVSDRKPFYGSTLWEDVKKVEFRRNGVETAD